MSQRLTIEELDAQFGQFLKESVSDDLLDFGGPDKIPHNKPSQRPSPVNAVLWWQCDKHHSGEAEREMTKSRFLKAKKSKPQQVEDSAAVKGSNVGLDTLEEEEEKTQFFSQLESGASSTINYSKLNLEQDSNCSSNLRKKEEQSDEGRVRENSRPSPGSPHYSDDFEEEPQQEKPKMTSMLSQVCFYDSLEDTDRKDQGKYTAASVDKAGPSYVQSSISEMEALQEAYQQIHMAKASEDKSDTIHRAASHPHSQVSLLPASKNESDLPTAEELMKPIRPEDTLIRSFRLHLFSPVGLDHDQTPHPFGKTFTHGSHSVSGLTEPPRHVGLKARIHSNMGETGPRSPSLEPLSRDLAWSIRKEVERLIQDPSSSHKAKKPSASTTHVSSTLARKPSAAPGRGLTVDRRPVALGRAVPSARKLSSISPRLKLQPKRAKLSPSRESPQPADVGVQVSSELVESVQSLVSVLQQQIEDSSSHQSIHLSNVVDKLRVELALKEEQLQRGGGAEEELQALRQQNYLLQSQLRSAEEACRRQMLEAADPAAEKKLQQMDREMMEQETLIRGYQQENEKMCEQIKAQQARIKSTEKAMFLENQRLLSELASTREQLNKTCRPMGSLCRMDHTQRITELLGQIQSLQRSKARMSEELNSLKLENQSLEAELQLMKRERELTQFHLTSGVSGDRDNEIQALEDKHRQELETLKKKLQWFTENQELLDRDAGRLKAATGEILQLREQVEMLKDNVGQKSTEQQQKSRVKSVETKRLQELERQVKELEVILRSRNPTSLPALIYAAASEERAEAGKAKSRRITELLERRIQRLEAELESHDEEAKRSLRSMEQQFDRIKLRYEQQISELEQKLEQKLQQKQHEEAAAEPWIAKLQAAEEKLQLEKQIHQVKEKSLREQVELLQEQQKVKVGPEDKRRPSAAPARQTELAASCCEPIGLWPLQIQRSPSRHQRHANEAFACRLERLNKELSAKTRTNQELQRTVERLQKERMTMLSRPRKPANPPIARLESFPSAQYEKAYQPTVFTGRHISEVVQENDDLQQRLEQQQQQVQQEKEARQAEARRAVEELCRVKEGFTQQISSMTAEHLRALERLQSDHALQHSSSRVAELSNQLSTQEVVIKQLQEQLEELRGVREDLTTSKTREEVLEEQVVRLLQQLKATDTQNPEVELLCGLKKMIVSMELKHQQREEQLLQKSQDQNTSGIDTPGALNVIGASRQTVANQSEVEHWRQVAQEKNRQVEAFRLELDSILDSLRHLQSQGVFLHGPQSILQRS